MTTKKYGAWLSRIADRATAASMTRECAIAMLFWAVVQTAFSFKYGNTLLIHAAILAAGGISLFLWKSRTAAAVLLLYALIAAGITLAINSGVPLNGNRNISLALLLLWTAIKAMEATFRLHGRFAFTAKA